MVRLAEASDIDAVVETITSAFHGDPLWGWAFPDDERRPAQYRRWWRLFVESAVPNRWTWVTENCESVALWVPPGASEMSPEAEAQVQPLLEELVGDRAPIVVEMLDRFEAAHPHGEPHYYLSVVATHAAHRGQGTGVALLAENLHLIDQEHLPSYLESSNPVNVARYQRLGFEPIGEFRARDDGPAVTQMWRAAR